jgi:hypothetical protein
LISGYSTTQLLICFNTSSYLFKLSYCLNVVLITTPAGGSGQVLMSNFISKSQATILYSAHFFAHKFRFQATVR